MADDNTEMICENGVCRMPDTDDEDFKRIMAKIRAAQAANKVDRTVED